MVIELKLKCYTCLDPIAPAGPADLICSQALILITEIKLTV